MLKFTTALILISSVSLAGYAQSVRIVQTSTGSQTREINNTAVPVIEKKEATQNNRQVKQPSQKRVGNNNIKPASNNNRQGTRPRIQRPNK